VFVLSIIFWVGGGGKSYNCQ